MLLLDGRVPNVLVNQSEQFPPHTARHRRQGVCSEMGFSLHVHIILHSFLLSFFTHKIFFWSSINPSFLSFFYYHFFKHHFFLLSFHEVDFLYHPSSDHLIISLAHHLCALCSSPEIWSIYLILSVTSSLFSLFSYSDSTPDIVNNIFQLA